MDRALRILVRAGFVRVPKPARDGAVLGKDVLATLMTNITVFGYALSRDAFDVLCRTSDGAARAWWEEVEPVLMDLTGADRKMDEHVVYQNFPHEVLAMSAADYWVRQILMYWGLPNEWFAEAPLPRAPVDEKLTARVLQPAQADTLADVFRALCAQKTRWTPEQKNDALFLADRFRDRNDLSKVGFKENMVGLAVQALERGAAVSVDTATDVLRVAVGMSGGDVSLRERAKLRRFRRVERKFLCGLLERAEHLEDDFARRPERMKRLVHALHPGDHAARFPRLVAAAKKLYEGTLPPTSNAVAEALLRARDQRALHESKARPGEMTRRLHHLVRVYGRDAALAFIEILPKLSLLQLLKTERYLAKVNERKFRLFPPRGDWARLNIVEADPKRRIPNDLVAALLKALAVEIAGRVKKRVPLVALDDATRHVKLPTNDSELLPYGRGTVFFIPKNVRFIRTASYWRAPARGNVWFDNGWNFFDDTWTSVGACCWDVVRFGTVGAKLPGAIFSGDPTNSKDLEGRACQLIDLYPDALVSNRVRYAVWNVLCYSRISFDLVPEVFAALQWGEEPQEGKLFEPARVALAFPLGGAQYTKYVAFLDLAQRRLVYIDANFSANVSSAAGNGKRLSKLMPPFVEYLDSLPSVHDVFAHAPRGKDGMPVAYSDEDVAIRDREAWVFRSTNKENSFTPFPLAALLG